MPRIKMPEEEKASKPIRVTADQHTFIFSVAQDQRKSVTQVIDELISSYKEKVELNEFIEGITEGN